MMRKFMLVALAVAAVSGCEAMKGLGFNIGDFGRDSEAMVGGGAKAGQDYITGLSMSENARQYFTSAAASSAQPVTVSRGNDNGTGVTWTDDGGIVIPPGTTIQFSNKGYCMDPHLPAPKAGDEMQFVKTSSLVPNQLRGTYKNLLERAANGDSEVQNNMQRLVWALRTAGSEDGYANNLTDRQRQILAECADENGSFESYQLMHKAIGKHLDWAKSKIDKWTGKVNDALQIKVGNFRYNALDLLDPDKAQQRVGEHLQTLIAQSVNLPVSKSGFNYGELAQGVYTDVNGNGILSFQAKVANSTSQPYTFYPMDYAAQVGSGRSQSTKAYFATSDETMRQRITNLPVDKVEATKTHGHGDSPEVAEGESDSEREWAQVPRDEKLRLLREARMARDSYSGLLPDRVRQGYSVATFEEIGEGLREKWNDTMNRYWAETGNQKGLSASLYTDDDGAIVVAFRGTADFKSARDDLDIIVNGNSPQVRYARELISLVRDSAGGQPIKLVGHSLGGYLAVAAALGNDQGISRISTYNSPGLDAATKNAFSPSQLQSVAGKTTNVYDPADVVRHGNNTLFGDGTLGQNVRVLNTPDSLVDAVWTGLKQAFTVGVIEAHGIDSLIGAMENHMGM